MPECIGFAEIDRDACGVLRYRYPGVTNYGDASLIVPENLPDFDLLCAGFPCQSFSIAGKRQGFNDTRGTLFFEIARILSHKRPAHFILENVRGLVSADEGKAIQRILEILTDLDYFVEMPVLNSSDFLVPQNRERCIFVGHLGTKCSREILSIEYGDENFNGEGRERNDIAHTVTNDDKARGSYDVASTEIYAKDGTRKRNTDYASTLAAGAHSGGNHSDMDLIKVGTLRTHNDGKGFREMHSGNCPTISARSREDGSGQAVIAITEQGTPQRSRVYDSDGLSPSVQSSEGRGGQAPAIAIPVLTPDRATKRQNGRRMKEDGEASFTVTAQDQHGIFNGQRIRRLTTVECARLQYFEDDWADIGINAKGEEYRLSDTAKYRVFGNAVTTSVIEVVVSRMLEVGCLK